MSSIDSSAYYSVGNKSSSSKGIAGLMSGMDTEAMVEKMLSGTQNKINKQEQLKQQALWKQDIYRDMISSINSFQSKYFDTRFDATLKTNFSNNNFFNAMISKIQSGNAVKLINTSTSATTGDFKVAVKQLASSSSMSSKAPVSSSNSIVGKALNDADLTKLFNKEIAFDIGTDTIKVDLNSVTSQDEMVSTVQKALDDGGITGVTAKIQDGKFRLVSTDPDKKITVNPLSSTALGVQMTGFGKASISSITNADGTKGKMLESSGVNMNAGYSVNLSLDGVQKTITVKDLKKTDALGNPLTAAQGLRDAFQEEVTKAFGDSVTVNLSATNSLEFALNMKDASGSPEAGHDLTITGADSLKFGFDAGTSTHLSTSSKLSSLGLGGDRFAFEINGTKFSFTGNDTIAKVMSTINNSGAGVRMTYSALSDTFKMEATSSGTKYGIKIDQTEGSLLTKFFGNQVAEGGAAGSKTLTTGSITGLDLPDDYTTEEASFKIRVNGADYTFNLDKRSEEDGPYTKDEIETQLNTWFLSKFGVGDGGYNISYADGKLSVKDGFIVEFPASNVDMENGKKVEEAMKSDLAFAMGFNRTAKSNVATADSNIADVYQLKDLTFYDKDGNVATKVSDIAKTEINGSMENVSYSDGRLSLKGSGTVTFGAGDDKLKALFGGKDSIAFGDGKLAADAVAAGKDAIVLLNGVETTRSSNNFTVDGITMELTQVSSQTGGVYDETVISTSRNADSIVDGFKSFVEDYNAMIEKLSGYVDEDADFRKYPPLTKEQKNEMSEKEIELWEENAKKGLVRGDNSTNTLLTQMRTILYSKPEGATLSLFQIGIDSSYSGLKDRGKLELDETKLRNALSADPDAVRNLFTDATNGLSKQMVGALDRAASNSFLNPGSLVQTAGVKGGTTEKNNSLYTNIQSIESRIKDLKVKYEKERLRYWNQFNSMESVMAQFNAQSASLSQQFGGYS